MSLTLKQKNERARTLARTAQPTDSVEELLRKGYRSYCPCCPRAGYNESRVGKWRGEGGNPRPSRKAVGKRCECGESLVELATKLKPRAVELASIMGRLQQAR